MAKFPRACFVPSDEETLKKWQSDPLYDDEEKMLYFPVYEDEVELFRSVTQKLFKEYNVAIGFYEEEDAPYECLEGCLELVNEVEALRDGNIAKALKKGIELKMPVSFHF